MLDSSQKESSDPIKSECPLLKDKKNLTEEKLCQQQMELDLLWDKIQETKQNDVFAAQIMYEKYKAKIDEIPPPIPEGALNATN